MRTLWLTFKHTAKLAGSHRKLWLPFLVTLCVEVGFISLCWLAPIPPFSKLLAPPVRYFFGERMLHYPWHLWFLYHVMKHTHFLASTVVGAFMSGLACALVQQTHQGRALSLHDVLASRQVRYLTVTVLWLLMWGAATGSVAAIGRFAPKVSWMGWASLAFFLLLQSLLVYVIPAAVFEGLRWWQALLRGMQEFLRYPISTFAIVAPVSLIMVTFSFFTSSGRVARWMGITTPEIVFSFMAARLVVWLVTDAVLTVAVAHLWWLHHAARLARADQRAAAAATTTSTTINAVRLSGLLMLCLMVLATSSGCSASYNGERLFWKAEQLSGSILKDPAHATADQFAKAAAAFNHVVTGMPGTSWAGRAQLALGTLTLLQKRYAAARDQYNLVIQNYSRFPEVSLSARLAIAKSYEVEQRWKDAVQSYHDVAEYHPWSVPGLQAPLYIAAMYEKRKETADAAKAYEHAVYVYSKLILNAPTPEYANQIKGLLVLAYQRLNRWDEAVATLEELRAVKQGGVNRPFILLTLGSIYQIKLHRPEQAEAVFSVLAREFPEHPFGKAAKHQLELLHVSKTPDGAAKQPATEVAPRPAASVPTR